MSAELPKRVLLTGATGFVGAHLARALAKAGCEVHVLARGTSDLAGAGIDRIATAHRVDDTTESVIAALRAAQPELVYHLASLFIAEHKSEQVSPLIDSNLRFPTQLLEAMAVTGVKRFVNTGTAWQHYEGDDAVCLYAATKTAFEALLDWYVSAHGIKALTLKLYDTYGPDDRRPKLFALLAKAARNGTAMSFSPGEQKLDPVHIDDVSAAFLRAGALTGEGPPRHERYAVTTGQPIKLRELIELYQKVKGVTINIEWGGRPYRAREVMEPWSGGATVPGWRAKIALADGIKSLPDA